MKINLFVLLLLTGLPYSCDRFEYSPYQISPGYYKEINRQNISRFIHSGRDTIRIALIGDTQRFYARTADVIEKINQTPGIDFVVHTGDLVDFGLQREYIWMHELLSELDYPYVAVVGNHDLIGQGGQIYKSMYGDFNFSFIFSGNKFIFLNTNSREYNFNKNVPDLSWLEAELADTGHYSNALVINHVPPFSGDFHPDLESTYASLLGRYDKTLMSINGHGHDFDVLTPYQDGIPYVNTFSTSRGKFILLTIWDNEYQIEIK
jgi:predicted MPP superfamily phosphohydrolase